MVGFRVHGHICHRCNDDAYEITCLSRYFPACLYIQEYGVRYSLFYYLLLLLLLDSSESWKMDTSSSLETAVVPIALRLPSQYMPPWMWERSSSKPPPPSRCTVFGASCRVDDDSVLSSLLYCRLQPRYIPPQRSRSCQETRNVRCLRPARPCFSVYCMCMLSTSFAQIFCGVCMVHGSRGAKKRWYKDALQTSLTG